MTQVHLICRKLDTGGLDGITTVDAKNHIYRSGAWDFDPAEAERLVGGQIYFHQEKKQASHYGGDVLSVETVQTDNAREERVVFTFRATKEGRGVAWSGANHGMAWTSSILD